MLPNYDYPWSQPYPPALGNRPLDDPAAAEAVVPGVPASPPEKPLSSEVQERSERMGAEQLGKRPPEKDCSWEEYEWMLLL